LDVKTPKEEEILERVQILKRMHQDGLLGGKVMPEDANPGFQRDSTINYLYFTLPMALNYQRNSYALWESALKSFHDKETPSIYDPAFVAGIDEIHLKKLL
jgi:hypothetical protein